MQIKTKKKKSLTHNPHQLRFKTFFECRTSVLYHMLSCIKQSLFHLKPNETTQQGRVKRYNGSSYEEPSRLQMPKENQERSNILESFNWYIFPLDFYIVEFLQIFIMEQRSVVTKQSDLREPAIEKIQFSFWFPLIYKTRVSLLCGERQSLYSKWKGFFVIVTTLKKILTLSSIKQFWKR